MRNDNSVFSKFFVADAYTLNEKVTDNKGEQDVV